MAKKDNPTAATEESSVYDSIISTCCCGSSSPGANSIAKEVCHAEKQRKNQHPPQEQDLVDEKPKFWDRLTTAALNLIGGAPPVNIIKCFDGCSSVDGSELTMPRVLSSMADEYDRNSKSQVHSIWSISEDTDGTPIDVNGSSARSGSERRRNRLGGRRWDKIKLKSSSESSYFSRRSLKHLKRENNALNKTTRRGKSKQCLSSGK